ncbi:rCG28003, partial [Rattus norvegicus]
MFLRILPRYSLIISFLKTCWSTFYFLSRRITLTQRNKRAAVTLLVLA